MFIDCSGPQNKLYTFPIFEKINSKYLDLQNTPLPIIPVLIRTLVIPLKTKRQLTIALYTVMMAHLLVINFDSGLPIILSMKFVDKTLKFFE